MEEKWPLPIKRTVSIKDTSISTIYIKPDCSMNKARYIERHSNKNKKYTKRGEPYICDD